MTRFAYKAVTAGGDVIEGVIEAANQQAVIDCLHSEGHVPIRAEEASAGLSAGMHRDLLFWRRPVGLKDLTVKTRELATMLQAGLPLDRCLSILQNLDGTETGRALVQRIQDDVRSGASLADAMEAHPRVFPSFYVGMIRAGEAGGNLEGVLQTLADSMERSQKLRESVSSALYYPILVVIMAVASLIVLMTAVVPKFQPLFEDSGVAMPLLTRIVIAVSEFLGSYWWALCLALLGLVLLVRQHNRTQEGRLRWDRWLLDLVVVGNLLLKIETARLARTLGTLSTNGVSHLNALEMTIGTVDNRAVAEALKEMRSKLAKGEGLSRPMADAAIFPTLAVQLVQVGEESSALEDMLLRVADIYDGEVQRALERLLALLVPAVTICLGILIAVIIGSMVSAILGSYDLPL